MRGAAKTIKAGRAGRRALPSFGEYVAGVVGQIGESARIVRALEGRPGDLDVMRREWARTIGLVESLAGRAGGAAEAAAGAEGGGAEGRGAAAYGEMASLCRAYSESYSFAREIDTMSGLYADDPGRLRNMRLKMCETYDRGRFLERLEGLAGEVSGGGARAEGGN